MRSQMKKDLAARLRRAINDRGWSPSEFARRCEERMPGGVRFGADTVSTYLNAKSLPNDLRLTVMAETLGMKKEDLMPAGALVRSSKTPDFEVKSLPDGRMHVYVSRVLPMDAAAEIAALMASLEKREGR